VFKDTSFFFLQKQVGDAPGNCSVLVTFGVPILFLTNYLYKLDLCAKNRTELVKAAPDCIANNSAMIQVITLADQI